MIRNYLTVALRNMLRYKGYAAINVLGLAIGMTTCILIVRYIQDELSVDGWHTKSDRSYRVVRPTSCRLRSGHWRKPWRGIFPKSRLRSGSGRGL